MPNFGSNPNPAPNAVLDAVRGLRLILYETVEWTVIGLLLSCRGSPAIRVAIGVDRVFVFTRKPIMSQGPSWRRSLGLVSVAVFAHRKDADGPVNYTISCNRRYYDGNEKSWKTSEYLGPTEIGAAVTLLKAAEAFLIGIQSDEVGGQQS